MRILHVVPSYVPAWRYGGPIRSVHGLCKALAARGHDVDVATTNVDGEEDLEVPLGRPVFLEGVKVHYFASTSLRRLYYSPPMQEYMEAGIAGWDIIHTHSVFLWPTTVAARLARRRAKPYVLSPRGMLVTALVQQRSAFLKRAWISLFERKNVESATAIHVTSEIEGDELLGMGFTPKRVLNIPNGLDLPGTIDRDNSKNYILFLGRISWKKGLDRLVEALALIPALDLVVAGNDDEGYWPQIEQRLVQLSLADRVRRLEFVEGHAKQLLIAEAMLLVLPSYSENFGNVVLEAMALGTPVIVTPQVGLAMVVAKTRSGLVTEGEPSKLANAIRALASDEALRIEMGENGITTAAGYSWDRIAEQMEVEYASMSSR